MQKLKMQESYLKNSNKYIKIKNYHWYAFEKKNVMIINCTNFFIKLIKKINSLWISYGNATNDSEIYMCISEKWSARDCMEILCIKRWYLSQVAVMMLVVVH